MRMTTGDEKQDIWVQQMRTVQKPRQRKVKEGHHDLSERKSISVRRGNTLLTVVFFKKGREGVARKGQKGTTGQRNHTDFTLFQRESQNGGNYKKKLN